MESGRVTIVETLILVLMGGPTRLGCSHAASSARTGTTGSTSFSRAKRTGSLCLKVMRLPFGRMKRKLSVRLALLQGVLRSEEHTSGLQSRGNIVLRLLVENM